MRTGRKPAAVPDAPPRPVAAGFRSRPTAQQQKFSELLNQRRRLAALQPGEDDAVAAPEVRVVATPHGEELPEGPPPAGPEDEHPDPPADQVATVALRPQPDKAPWKRVIRDVAQAVAGFCNDPAVSASDDWQIDMELDPAVAADTTLHLALSQHWLTLRFQTGDGESKDLLSQGMPALITALDESLQRKREISIGFDTP